jgi:hypothetical protein
MDPAWLLLPSTIEREKTDQAQARPCDYADPPGTATPTSSGTATTAA